MDSNNMETLVRAALRRAIKESGLSREEIAAKVTEQSGVLLTKSMLDAYTAESRADAYKLPLALAPFVDKVTGTYELTRFFNGQRGVQIVPERQALEIELDDIIDEIKRLKKRAKHLKIMLEAGHGMV